MDERCNVSDNLVEKIEVVKCVECPISKLESETLKVQLTHVTSLSNACSSSSVKDERFLIKILMSLEEIKEVFHLNLFDIIVEIRVTLGFFVMLGNFKFPME